MSSETDSPEEREDAGEEASTINLRETNLAELELVAVARVVKTRGVRGEVAAELLTDFPERFEWLTQLVAVTSAGERSVLDIEEQWLHGMRLVLKFAGYDTPEASAALVGYELAVPESEAVELEEGEFYEWELVGCRAEGVDGTQLGTVSEVLHTGGDAPVLVIRDDVRRREHLVPLVESICVEIDTERKLIRIDAPEGLIET